MGLINAAKVRLDAWANVFTGLGGARDKRLGAEAQQVSELDLEVLRRLYDGDDLAATICDALPEDALREGFGLDGGPDGDGAEDRRQAVLAALRELGVREKLVEVLALGRAYGGAALLVGADDGAVDLALPLADDRVREMRYLTVLERADISPWTWDTNPRSPGFGRPETYQVSATSGGGGVALMPVHASRLILCYGARTSPRSNPRRRGWSYSVLQRAYPVIRDFQATMGSVGLMLQDGSQAVYYLDGLIDMMGAPGGQAAIQTRMEVVDMGRSVARALILDAEKERFDFNDRTFAGVRDVVEMEMLRLAAAARMPVTRLFGRSPAGLNATGESDLEVWYASVQSYRTHVVEPAIRRLAHLVGVSLGIAEPFGVTWPSLWVEGPKQLAERSKLVADADAIYITQGVYDPDEVARARAVGPDAPVVVDLEARDTARGKEDARARMQAEAMVAAATIAQRQGPSRPPAAPAHLPEPD